MKVLLVSPDDLARESGVNKQVNNLARTLAQAGDTVHIAGPTASKVRLGDNVHSFFAMPDGSKKQSSLIQSQMQALLAREDYDLVHAYEPFLSPLTHAAVESAQASVATFFSRPLGEDSAKASFWGRLAVRRHAALTRRMGAVIATSRSVQADVREAFGLVPRVIPVGIDFGRFHPRAQDTQRRAGPRDPIKVLFIGDWQAPERGFQMLHEALLRVSRQQPVELDIIGGGSGPNLARTPSFGARFLGRVSELRLPELYRHADVVVAPAVEKQVSGSALLEAMACGVAVVASDVGPYRELAAGSGAVLFPRGNVDALTSAITVLGARPDERALRGEANAMAAHAYRWDRLIGDLRDAYEAALSSGRITRAPRERVRPAARQPATPPAEEEAPKRFHLGAG